MNTQCSYQDLRDDILSYHNRDGDGCALNAKGEPIISEVDWFHQRLDYYVARLWVSEREIIVKGYGIDKAINLYLDNQDGRPTVMGMVYIILQEEMEKNPCVRRFLDM
jgi:hypothetical protein